jgi:hypothetical protein
MTSGVDWSGDCIGLSSVPVNKREDVMTEREETGPPPYITRRGDMTRHGGG